MYYVMRASVPSLHRESTDSLIIKVMQVRGYIAEYNYYIYILTDFML